VTDGFTLPPKEVVQLIFIALKNPSLSAGFEPAHDNLYTSENDRMERRRQGLLFRYYPGIQLQETLSIPAPRLSGVPKTKRTVSTLSLA
jgi:hypothetical protein